jgi:hypothetical protein
MQAVFNFITPIFTKVIIIIIFAIFCMSWCHCSHRNPAIRDWSTASRMSPAHETQSMREIRFLRGRLPRKGGGLTGTSLKRKTTESDDKREKTKKYDLPPTQKSSTIKSWPTFCDQYFWKFPIWNSRADEKRREIRMVKVLIAKCRSRFYCTWFFCWGDIVREEKVCAGD